MEWKISQEPEPYPEAVAFMEARACAIREEKAGELVWLLEHPALYTAGTSADDADLLDARGLPVYKTGRGGQYTYHGPGQRVAYVMLDLSARGRDVHAFVTALQAWIIEALARLGVRGDIRDGRVGVWVERPILGGGAVFVLVSALLVPQPQPAQPLHPSRHDRNLPTAPRTPSSLA